MTPPVAQFRAECLEALAQRFPGAECREIEANRFRLKLRVFVSGRLFLDAFYSPRTSRIGVAVILDERRVFGIDNLAGWHTHPVADPDKHIPSRKMTVFELVSACGEAIDRLAWR